METRISSLEEYIGIICNYSRDFFYRGVSKSTYPLIPSVGRIFDGCNKGKALHLEANMINNFYSHIRLFEKNIDFLNAVLLAQHHGLPTRFMDWTLNPLVALFFSVIGNTDSDGIVYITYQSHTYYFENIKYKKYILFSDNEEKKDFISTENVDIGCTEMNSRYEIFHNYFRFIVKKYGNNVAFFDPPKISARMATQKSYLSFHPDPFTAMNTENMHKIIVPSDIKDAIRGKLETIGTHEYSLFPTTEGLCQWLYHTFYYHCQHEK